MRERLINLLWLCIEQGGRILSSFLITILVVNHLGPEKFGILSLGLAILTALGPIVGLGMDSILFKRFISRENSEKALIETSCYLRLTLSLIVIVLVTLLNLLSDESFIKILNILVVGFIFDSFLSLKDYFAAGLKNKYYTYSTLLSLLAQLVFTYALVENGANLVPFAFAYVAAKVVQSTSLYASYFYGRKSIIIPRLHKNLAKDLLVSSYPMMLAASIGLLYSLQDQFFIKIFLSEYELGIYAVGIKLVVVLIVLPTMISNVFYPSLVSKYNQKNKEAYSRQLEGVYLMFFLLGAIIFLLLYLSSDILIDALFQDEFSRSTEVMRVYSILLVLSFFQSINNKILILNNLQKVIFKRALIALSINALLNIIFIPKYGIVGAAYSTVLSELFVVFSYIFRADTRFIFIYQLKAVLLINLFKPDFIKSLKA